MPSKMKTCEDYRTVLTDAAAGAFEPSLELRSHLDACASCRAAFAEETQLFAAIDLGVRIEANAEVPASLLPRVRVQLNEQRTPRRTWIPAGAVLAAAVALVMVIVSLRVYKWDEKKPSSPMLSAADQAIPAKNTAAPTVAEKSNTSAIQKKFTKGYAAVNTGRPPQVFVLIPSGQKEALDKLLGALQNGSAKQDPLVADKSQPPSQGLALLPLAISPMAIEPLATVSQELAQGNETTRF